MGLRRSYLFVLVLFAFNFSTVLSNANAEEIHIVCANLIHGPERVVNYFVQQQQGRSNTGMLSPCTYTAQFRHGVDYEYLERYGYLESPFPQRFPAFGVFDDAPDRNYSPISWSFNAGDQKFVFEQATIFRGNYQDVLSQSFFEQPSPEGAFSNNFFPIEQRLIDPVVRDLDAEMPHGYLLFVGENSEPWRCEPSWKQVKDTSEPTEYEHRRRIEVLTVIECVKHQQEPS